jgi:hypothetical protein
MKARDPDLDNENDTIFCARRLREIPRQVVRATNHPSPGKHFRRLILLLVATVPALSSATTANTPLGKPFAELGASRFGKLSLAEERLVNAVVNEGKADCRGLSGEDKKIRGELVSWLCTDPDASAQVGFRGILMTDAEIVNKVDLEWAKISFPLGADRCVFRDSIILSHGHFLFFGLQGGSVSRLEANGSQFAGRVFLRSGIKVEGGVDFLGAKIDGDLDCSGG